MNPAAENEARGLARWLPALRWLKSYERAWFRADLVAGLTLAAYLVPAAIGDASLALLPPEAGLYACLFSGLVFWLFCSSRHTAITVTSAISLLVGSSLGTISDGDPARFGVLAAGTAVLVALLALLAWIVKGGAIVNFISETVLTGFKAGIALVLTSTQLPKLCGFSGSHGDFWERLGYFISHRGETNAASLITGLVALGVLVLGKRLFKDKPVALFVVAGGIAAASLFHLETFGVKLLGDVPEQIPIPRLPVLQWSDWNELLPLAFACFLLGAVETAAIGRMFATKHRGRFDSNQEFLALAGANLAAGLGQGFPVSGGMSQSLVSETGGAKTPLCGLIASLVMLLVTVFLSALLRDLPQPVLAAIVLFAVAGLFKLSALTHLWRTARGEFAVAAAAILGVLGSGVLRGVLIGAVISLIILIHRAANPHVAVLGRIPGSRRYSDLERHPDNEKVPGLLLCRPEAGLVYFNADQVRSRILERVGAESLPPKLVICDLSASPGVDIQSAQTLAELHHELAGMGIRFQLVEALAVVRDTFRAEGLEETFGRLDRFTSVADAVEAFQGSAGATTASEAG
jgi:sulfate permease, SulP family